MTVHETDYKTTNNPFCVIVRTFRTSTTYEIDEKYVDVRPIWTTVGTIYYTIRKSSTSVNHYDLESYKNISFGNINLFNYKIISYGPL